MDENVRAAVIIGLDEAEALLSIEPPLRGKGATARFGGGGVAPFSMKIDVEIGQRSLRKFGWEAERDGFAATKPVREGELIVFMVAAPLTTSGIPVDLPKIQAKQLNDQKPPIVVGVDANGGFFVAAITASSAII